MKLTANITGLLDLKSSDIQALEDRARTIVLTKLDDLAREPVNQMKSDIKLIKSKGQVYSSKRGGKHIASQPGFPPNEDTGNLSANIKKQVGSFGLIISSEAKSQRGFPYSVALETGTKNMEPRPYFFKAIDRFIKGLRARRRQRDIKLAIRNALISQRRKRKILLAG